MECEKSIQYHNWDVEYKYGYDFYEFYLDGTDNYIGYIRLDHGYICGLWVEPEFRKLGCATAMLDYIEKISGESKIGLTVHKNNIPAYNLYLKLGYTIEYENEFRYVMSKQIGGN